MIRLGLTGSIGMGKSEASAAFRALGVPVFDSDAEVHDILAHDVRAIEEISHSFPNAVVGGVVDRQKLGAFVFGDQDRLEQLEAILHPRVGERRDAFVVKARQLGTPLVVFDVPLLFETGGDAYCDKVLVISAPADIQRQRVLARNGMTEEKMSAILQRQMSDPEKRHRADFVISGADGIETLRRDVARLVKQLTESSKLQR